MAMLLNCILEYSIYLTAGLDYLLTRSRLLIHGTCFWMCCSILVHHKMRDRTQTQRQSVRLCTYYTTAVEVTCYVLWLGYTSTVGGRAEITNVWSYIIVITYVNRQSRRVLQADTQTLTKSYNKRAEYCLWVVNETQICLVEDSSSLPVFTYQVFGITLLNRPVPRYKRTHPTQ